MCVDDEIGYCFDDVCWCWWMAALLVPPGTSYCIRLVDGGEGAHIPHKIFRHSCAPHG